MTASLEETEELPTSTTTGAYSNVVAGTVIESSSGTETSDTKGSCTRSGNEVLVKTNCKSAFNPSMVNCSSDLQGGTTLPSSPTTSLSK